MKTNILVLILTVITTPVLADEKPWTAMTVYSDGKLQINEGISSEGVCREALCMVKDKMTCAQKAAADERDAAARKKAQQEYEKQKAAYRVDHPCVTKVEDWGNSADGKQKLKRPISRCALPDGGEEVYNEKGELIMSAGGYTMSSQISYGSPPPYVSKQVCFQ